MYYNSGNYWWLNSADDNKFDREQEFFLTQGTQNGEALMRQVCLTPPAPWSLVLNYPIDR